MMAKTATCINGNDRNHEHKQQLATTLSRKLGPLTTGQISVIEKNWSLNLKKSLGWRESFMNYSTLCTCMSSCRLRDTFYYVSWWKNGQQNRLLASSCTHRDCNGRAEHRSPVATWLVRRFLIGSTWKQTKQFWWWLGLKCEGKKPKYIELNC